MFDFDFKFDFNFNEDDEFIYKKKNKIKEIIKNQIDSIEKIKIPQKNEQIRIVTQKSISPFSLLDSFIQKGETINELYISIFSISMNVTELLIQRLKERKIKKAYILVNDFFKNQSQDWYEEFKAESEINKNLVFGIYNVHTKVNIFKIKERYFVFEGSGNLSNNAKVEQYMLEENKNMYDFHKKWIKRLLNLDFINKENMKGAVKKARENITENKDKNEGI